MVACETGFSQLLRKKPSASLLKWWGRGTGETSGKEEAKTGDREFLPKKCSHTLPEALFCSKNPLALRSHHARKPRAERDFHTTNLSGTKTPFLRHVEKYPTSHQSQLSLLKQSLRDNNQLLEPSCYT